MKLKPGGRLSMRSLPYKLAPQSDGWNNLRLSLLGIINLDADNPTITRAALVRKDGQMFIEATLRKVGLGR